MTQINDHYLKLQAGYLFPEIGRRVAKFAAENPDAKIIRLGIGDVTEPLPPAIIEAMHKAVDEMERREMSSFVLESRARAAYRFRASVRETIKRLPTASA